MRTKNVRIFGKTFLKFEFMNNLHCCQKPKMQCEHFFQISIQYIVIINNLLLFIYLFTK